MVRLLQQLNVMKYRQRYKFFCMSINSIHSTARKEQSASKDYYKILNIEKNSTRKNIKHAYYKLSKQYHPDVNDQSDAEAKFKEIQEAYHVLGDDIRKNAYDISINEAENYYDRRQSSGPGYRPNAGENRRARNPTDFNEYYRSQYGDRSRPKSYSNYGPSTAASSTFSGGARMSQQELNNYWNKQKFESNDEIKDAYKRLLYSITFSFLILFSVLNLCNSAVKRESRLALDKAVEVSKNLENKKI